MPRPTVTSLREIAVPAYVPTILASTGTGATLPVMALSARDLGAGVGMAAFVVALLGIGQLAGDLPAGALVQRTGERVALLIACGVVGLGMLGCLLAPSVPVLAGAVLVVGVANSVFGLARQAYLTDAVDVDLRARALSTLGGVHRIGIFTGPFVGAAVVSAWGVNAAYGVGLVASLASFLVVLGCPDITAEHESGASRDGSGVARVLMRHWRVLATLGVGVLLISVARSARITILPLWGQAIGLDAAATSLVFGISGAVDMLLFYPAGWVMDRYGRVLVAVPSLLVMGLGMAVLPLTHSFWTLTTAGVILGVGNGISAGIMLTLGADAAPIEGRAQFLGGWRLMADSGWALGPALISVLAATASLALAALVLGALSVAGAGWMRVWVPRYDPISRRTLTRDRRTSR
ncbi:MAG: MFS transporter [Dermatophilaceae bacterium]